MNQHIHSLQWIDISFSIDLPQSSSIYGPKVRKSILNNISGHVSSGNICAILGPSGSGKTCLLNILGSRMLCNRSLNPILTGSIFFDGKAVNSKFFRRNVAFVSQDDNLFSYLTVYETLLLSAHFSFPVNTSKYELLSAVDSTLSQLGLSKVKNTIIGSSTRRGVSGGEKKRVAIAKEVLSNPSIIFMDEPTSGLDSYQAQSVIRSFQTMANQGKIIITVIHQPRSSIFSMFHNILLLAEGSVIYFGPTEACVSYFSRLGHVCPTMYNPADYILDLVSTDSSSVDTKTASKSRVDALVLEWKTQHANDPTNYYSQDIEIENKIDDDDENQLECADSDTDEVKERDYATDHFNSYFSGSSQLSSYLLMNNHSDFRNQRSQCRHILLSISTGIKDFQVLTWRSSCQLYRNYFSVSIKLVTLIFFAAILSLIYRRMGHTQNSIQDRIGILFFITSNQSFGPLIGAINTFPEEKGIVRNEQTSCSYSTLAYFIGRFAAEIPLQIIGPVAYGSILYWSVNFNPDPARFLIFLIIIVLEGMCALALGFAISAVSPTTAIANALGPPILIVLIIFGGFYINSESLPIGSQWVQYISYVKWTFQALAINEFVGEHFSCDSSADDQMDCESSGDAVLDRYSFEVGSSGLISSSNLNPSFVSGHLGLVLCQPVDIPLPGISDSRVSAAYIYWSQVFKVEIQ